MQAKQNLIKHPCSVASELDLHCLPMSHKRKTRLNVLYVMPTVCGSSVFIFVLLCVTLCPFWFCNHLKEEEKAGCFAIVVLPMYSFMGVVALPHGALDLSAVCDFGFSWLYSLTFYMGLRCM